MRLTELAVKKIANPKNGQDTHWDEITPGFGLRCSTRAKSFVVMYGRTRKLKTLGRYPELSLANARREAKRALLDDKTLIRSVSEVDYGRAVRLYLSDCNARLRPSTLEGYSLYLNGFDLKGPLTEITRADLQREIGKLKGRPSSQNYAFTTAKVFLNWALRHELITANPLSGLNRPNRTVSRERTLDDEELIHLLNYTLNHRDRFNDIVTLLALTGQRRGEIASLEWSDIDGDSLTLSGEKTKNKRAHTVPLGRRAQNILTAIEGGSRFVFSTADADRPFSGWTRAKKRLDQKTGLSNYTLHDLRRTYSTIHAKIGTPIHVTERLLNHVSGTISGVAAVYNRHSYLEEMRQAVEGFEDYLENLFVSQDRFNNMPR